MLGDREVVHDDGFGKLDVDRSLEGAIGTDLEVLQIGLEGQVGEREHLAGARVDLGVGGERAVEATVEVVDADGVQ